MSNLFNKNIENKFIDNLLVKFYQKHKKISNPTSENINSK